MIEAEPQEGLNLAYPFSMGKGPKMKIELDRKALFALASDSRVEILRGLQPSRRTITQLAETLEMDKGAVHRHLKKLEEGGLVTRYEEHGFVYHGLSWKARDIISPGENTRIIITFALSVVMALSTVGAIFMGFVQSNQKYTQVGQGSPLNTGNTTNYLTIGGISWEWIVLAIVLGVAAVGLTYMAGRRIWRPRQALEMEGKDQPADCS